MTSREGTKADRAWEGFSIGAQDGRASTRVLAIAGALVGGILVVAYVVITLGCAVFVRFRYQSIGVSR